jgi:rhodanese-related sulfurtransferase
MLTPTPTPTTTPTPIQLSLYSPLTAKQVHALLQSDPSIIIIDARATDEYTGAVAAGDSVGHIRGAYSVPDDGNAAKQLYKFPDKTQSYICYCDTAACTHGMNVASIMSAAGFTNVTYMSDGIAGWTAQGYSLVTGG